MGWGSAIKKKSAAPSITNVVGAKYELAKVDWDRLVTLDFETYYDPEYTLKKMSTSEYVRDPRFKAQMVGIKIGNKKTRTFTGAAIALQGVEGGTGAAHQISSTVLRGRPSRSRIAQRASRRRLPMVSSSTLARRSPSLLESNER